MKRRKGVTVFGAFTLTFAILAIASYAVILLALLPMVKGEPGVDVLEAAFDVLARNKDIVAAFSDFKNIDVVPHIITWAYIGIFVLVAIIWLIVDLKRNRKIVFFFLCTFLVACYADLIYNLTVFPLKDFITENVEAQPLLFVPLGGALLGGLASLFAIILFIVDMATGKVNKEAQPTFIKEPTEEVQEGVFEEVKDESEVEPAPVEEKVEEPAPVAAEEAKEEVEEAPEEEKEEEEPAPAKKPSAPKKVKKEPAKKAPAKKAEPKKEEKKPEPKKAPAKKPAPKEDEARKTGTIVLENEEGKTYAKAFHVSRRAELNKWQVKATGSDKALKLFNTQKEAIEYANQLAKNQNVSVRVHSKEGKIRKHQ